MVGLPGLEPGTSVLSGPRSNHLSYRPSCALTTPVVDRKRATRRPAAGEPGRNPARTEEPAPSPARPGGGGDGLPRKEVIQPHLPVRLPCYDFVPIPGLALDGWPPSRGHPAGFRRPRLS